MAIQLETGTQDLAVLDFQAFIRGYHAYQEIWDPQLGDVLRLERELTNCLDKFAVAVMNGSSAVGHLPYNIAPTISHFLKRSVNKVVVEVTARQVNRGAGYGWKYLASADCMVLGDTSTSSRNSSP